MMVPHFEPTGEPVPPDVTNHTVCRRIGRGSYGEVWLAEDAMGKYRAVKVVSRWDGDRADRAYGREFEAIRRYEEISRSHGSLMPILSVGRAPSDRYFYYTMELADDANKKASLNVSEVTKETIRAYVPHTLRVELQRRGRLSSAECIKHGLALATALERLHAANLIHRDIKPDNIIFVHGCPKLADVGLMAYAEATYSFVGTTAYLSPELPRGKPADVFALGKVLYEMASGREAEEFPAPPSNFGQFCEKDRNEFNELNQVILKATQPELCERYASATELHADLDLLQKGESLLRLRELEERDRHARQRARVWGWSAVAVVFGLLLTLLVNYVWTVRQRAITETLRSLVREIQISRMQLRNQGWFTNYWNRLSHAAAVQRDDSVLSEASALLAGMDARARIVLKGTEAGSAVFAADGRLLVGGVGNGHSILIDTNGAIRELPTQGDGPVCWAFENEPWQLVAVPNGVVLRHAISGKVRREFSLAGANPSLPETNPVLAITQDGTLVGACLRDRLVIFDAVTGKLVGETKVTAGALSFSPDNSLVAVGGMEGTTHIYSASDLLEIAVLQPALRGNRISCLAFCRDPVIGYQQEQGTDSWLLAVGDQGAGIVIWDLAKRVPRSFCRGSTWTVAALAFSPDGLTLASAGRNQPRLWDVASGLPLLQLDETSGGTCLALAFDRTGHRLLTGGLAGGGNAVTALWELEPHRGMHALRGLASPIRKVWFALDNRHVAALSDDWHLGVWDLSLDRVLFTFEMPTGSFADSAAGCFDASTRQFAFATGHEARLYDLATGQVLKQWRLNEGFFDQMQFDTSGRLYLLRCERTQDSGRTFWRFHELSSEADPKLLYEQVDRTWSADTTAFDPRSKFYTVSSGGPNGEPRIIRAYDVHTGKILWTMDTGTTEGFVRVHFDPVGLVFGYESNLPSGEPCLRLFRSSDFTEIGYSTVDSQVIGPSGNTFAGNGWFMPDRHKPQHLIPLATEWFGLAYVSTFSPDGRLLAWGTEQGVVVVANLQEVQRRLADLGRSNVPTKN